MRHGTTWVHQWDRILRWRERVLVGRDEGRTDALGTEGYRDEVFALMQAIWHLKDWLINDEEVVAEKRHIETWIQEESTVLSIAADVANGSKHLRLTSMRAGGSGQMRNDVTVMVGVGVKHTFYVRDARSDAEYEAIELADRCLQEWRALLAGIGVTVPAALSE